MKGKSMSLTAGLTTTRTFKVDEERTIGFMGKDVSIYATPFMIRDIETTCRDFLKEHISEGDDSVGTVVEIEHTAPTLLGMEVKITVTVSGVNGRAIMFDVVAHDDLDQICRGRHGRFISPVEKTKARLKDKADKLARVK
jgi:predicted thioesterase